MVLFCGKHRQGQLILKDYITKDDYAEKLVNEHFVAGKDDHIVPVGKLKDDRTLESNNYIVFVKVMDNVGNSMIYGSNGVVLENFHDITVTYKEDPAETNSSAGNSKWHNLLLG